ncbi:MAG: response regulator [Bacteroidota bacterium]
MRVLLIDDERLARQEMKKLLKDFVHIDVIGECSNAQDAVKKIHDLRPDLIFLDIQMPGMDGFEMLEQLEYVPKVIFVTAYDEFALKAFDVNALDYLLKPIESPRLEEALKRVQEEMETPEDTESIITRARLKENDQIFLKDGDKCWFVTLKDVRLLESEGNYVRFYFNNFKPLILKSLNNLEERLDGKTFFRANRKYIVNLKWVESMENWFNGGLMLTLKDQTKVEVSRRQAVKFKDLMSL